MKIASIVTIILILSITSISFAQKNDKVEVNQISVPMVTLLDSSLISFFLDEFFIPETLVTKMDIIDVSLNGFGENDIVKLYPSDNVYFLQFVSDAAQKRMNQWEFKANFQITAQNEDVSIADDYESNKPAYNIFGAILKGLNQNYQDLPIKIRFERDSSTVLFELWGHTREALRVIPKEEPRVKDVLLEQIAVKSDTTLYDCIFIYKTLIDTVYLRERSK
ncbi:hypothetical protein GF337_12715 [candidate division KSB1 bacterium]|nr:hypothetical protein [candidate division KSB1 bacterium]